MFTFVGILFNESAKTTGAKLIQVDLKIAHVRGLSLDTQNSKIIRLHNLPFSSNVENIWDENKNKTLVLRSVFGNV